MAFRLDEVRGSLKKGVARTSHYEMLVGERDITYRVISVTAPGRSIAAAPSGIYGAPQEVGYSAIYAPITAQIYCSPDHSERKFFSKWQDSIVGPVRQIGTIGDQDRSFDAGYYHSYVENVELVQYDEAGKKTHTIKLREAYPRTVGELTYSYQASELLLFTVSLQYRYYTET